MLDSTFSNNLVKLDSSLAMPGLFVHAIDIEWEDTEFKSGGLLVKTDVQSNYIKDVAKWMIVSKKDSNKESLKVVLGAQPNKETIASSLKDDNKQSYRQPAGQLKPKDKYSFFKLPSFFDVFKFNSLKDNFNPNEVELPSPRKNGIVKAYYDRVVRAKLLRSIFKADKLVPVSLATQVTVSSLSDESIVAKEISEKLHLISPVALSIDYKASNLHHELDTASDVLMEVIDTISRNPSSLQLVSKAHKQDKASYQHSIDVSILMVAFGREMCFPRHELLQIGIGGLLHDIGEIEISNKTDAYITNIASYKIYKEHIQRGLEIADSLSSSSIVKQMIANHHEHFDGSGYPNKLKGVEIGFFASMLTIVDSFVSLTTGRSSCKQLTPSKAIKLMYRKREAIFHPELLDQFIRMIGIYPVGTVVKLASGEVGLVIKQNKTRKLKPVVMLLKDKNMKLLKEPTYVDLLKNENEGGDLFIAREVSPESVGITPESYLVRK